MQKLDKRIVVYRGKQYEADFPDDDAKLTAVIEWLQTKLAEVPEQYRAEARCEISSEGYYDSTHATIEISYARIETDDESVERERQSEALRAAEERHLLAQLERVRSGDR